jgi:hypothetical protein
MTSDEIDAMLHNIEKDFTAKRHKLIEARDELYSILEHMLKKWDKSGQFNLISSGSVIALLDGDQICVIRIEISIIEDTGALEYSVVLSPAGGEELPQETFGTSRAVARHIGPILLRDLQIVAEMTDEHHKSTPAVDKGSAPPDEAARREYSYIARNKNGEEVNGKALALSDAEAIKIIRERGLDPISIDLTD